MRPAPFNPLLPALLLCLGCTVDSPVEPAGQPVTAGGVAALPAPPGLGGTAVSGTRVDLAWSDNSTNETGFQVYRSLAGSGGSFELWATLPVNATAATDAAAQPGTEYCFRVRAQRKTGSKTTFSAFSQVACATTPLPPPPPPPTPPAAVESLDVTPYASSAVWMRWGVAGGQTGFRVERSRDGGGSWSHIATVVDGYYEDQGLTSDQEVCYRIIAFNLGGDAPPSGRACTAPPTAPSNLTGTLTQEGAVELRWTDNSSVEDGYEVWIMVTQYNHDCDAGCFDYTEYYLVGWLPANSTRYTCADCVNWPTFVWATKDGGSSNISNEVLVTSSP